MKSNTRWLWNGFIVLLILIGVGASASFYFRTPANYHRQAGRVLVILSLIAGFTSIFITLVIPYAGWTQRLVVGPFAIFHTVVAELWIRRMGR